MCQKHHNFGYAPCVLRGARSPAKEGAGMEASAACNDDGASPGNGETRQLLEELAADYSQFFKVDISNDKRILDEGIDELLARLDEFTGLINMKPAPQYKKQLRYEEPEIFRCSDYLSTVSADDPLPTSASNFSLETSASDRSVEDDRTPLNSAPRLATDDTDNSDQSSEEDEDDGGNLHCGTGSVDRGHWRKRLMDCCLPAFADTSTQPTKTVRNPINDERSSSGDEPAQHPDLWKIPECRGERA
ncbi:hypothetical protein HPB52_020715 [Rhipicephalus sanguineus]|uniref:Uncharacterized protein n=1 Tax=Rhipicephalus sanguineus TaxID=34632 RepID=A0A9D4T1Q7_RHISA|nr:hypothetical protein HPB52_020715 [Rhipicephalus sanguineus]